jgi:mono/diheme cytochrome c family protein
MTGNPQDRAPTSQGTGREPRLLLRTALTLLAVYLVLRFVVPWLSRWFNASHVAAPVPRFAIGLYLGCALLGALVYVGSDERRWRLFMGPIVRLFAMPPARIRWPQLLMFGLIPLLAGAWAWRRVMPGAEPPAVLRLQHPAMPRQYASLENPLRKLPEAARRAAEEEGVVLFQKNCRPCHGVEADGSGPLARGLRLRPVNFRDPGTIATVVEPYVFWRIKEGGMGLPAIATPWESAMPAWSDLADDQIWKIVLATYAIAGKEPRKPEAAPR